MILLSQRIYRENPSKSRYQIEDSTYFSAVTVMGWRKDLQNCDFQGEKSENLLHSEFGEGGFAELPSPSLWGFQVLSSASAKSLKYPFAKMLDFCLQSPGNFGI